MRILITGASGLLGANVALEAAAAGHRVFGVTNRSPLRTQAFTVLTANLLDTGVIDRLLEHTQPDWVIHCAALANLEDSEKDPGLARRLNSELPGILAEACRKGGARLRQPIRLLHVSTDAVFDGIKGNYTEADEPRPQNVYAQSKLDGERAVAAVNPDALIARVNLFGFSPGGRRSLAEFFLYNLMEGKRVNGFTDVFFCPMLVNDIAPIFFRMLGGGLAGLYHVFSSECLSKYHFGVRIAERFGLDAGLIAPVSVEAGGLAARRSPNLRMNVAKLMADLGEELPSVSGMLERFYLLYQQGFSHKIEGLINRSLP
jgi:dTDP-4-dehydrorhamnose reductase